MYLFQRVVVNIKWIKTCKILRKSTQPIISATLLLATIALELGTKRPDSYIYALSMVSKHVFLPGQCSDIAMSPLLS